MLHHTKINPVEATKWNKNGDHPLDNCQKIKYSDGSFFETEGRIVRYYRRPDVPGNRICEHCGIEFHYHGWIDSGGEGQIVCPGDYIITIDMDRYYPMASHLFEQLFKEYD